MGNLNCNCLVETVKKKSKTSKTTFSYFKKLWFHTHEKTKAPNLTHEKISWFRGKLILLLIKILN